MATKEMIDSLTITPNKHLFLSVTHYGYRGTYYDGFLILQNDDLTFHFPDDQQEEALKAWLKVTGRAHQTEELVQYLREQIKKNSETA